MPTSSSNAEDVDEVNPPDDDLVVTNVRTAYSKYRTTACLRLLLDVQDILETFIPDGVFSLRRCTTSDLVFHDRGSSSANFFFMYALVLKDSCIRIPVDDFCAGILCVLNVAPTQLYPNSWAYVRAFQILCTTLDISPTIPLFLHHYLSWLGKKLGWLSLVS